MAWIETETERSHMARR